MASPASIAKHPLHPMLIAFPIGLWVFSFVSDIVFLASGNDAWSLVAYYTMGGGIIGALVAAMPGFIDYLSLSQPRVKNLATWHMVINLTIVVIFIIDFSLRMRNPLTHGLPFILSILGVLLLGLSGWLGGELVYVHGVAVEQQK
ncbi:MAG TPA: DUF2231 domain-containing protein [bacterium]|jgi:uncharacterized membrane protein